MLTQSELSARFTDRYPEFVRFTQRYFRATKDPSDRADKVSDSLALAWQYCVAKQPNGIDDKLMLACVYNACRHAYGGRRSKICDHKHTRDIMGEGSSFVRSREPVWKHIYDGRDNPAEIVAAKLDFEVWNGELSERDQQRIRDMSLGLTGVELAAKWHVTPGAVTMARKALERSYYDRVGK
jgi:hypothetical protein